jgi:CelD/BcsL family acetyltransferase involved in cellulose biosynthesis
VRAERAPRDPQAIPSRRHRERPGVLAARVHENLADVILLRNEWRDLYRAAAPRNPFGDPVWPITWAKHFVRDGDLAVVSVREGDALVGVAPFYRRSFRVGGPLVHSLQAMGSVEHVMLFERPHILAFPGMRRRVLRSVMDALVGARPWDWIDVSLQSDQGWFEPQWVEDPASSRYVVPKGARPSVGIDLPSSAEELERTRKRNLRESLRRARNRLRKTGLDWHIEVVGNESAFPRARADLLALHRARSNIPGRVRHPDAFADRRDRVFAEDVLDRAAAFGAAEALFVRVGSVRAAGLMTLLAPDATYFSFSGVDPDWWSYSLVTLLQLEAMKRAIHAGRTYADLSVGVDVAKLRWSEETAVHTDFAVVSRRRRSEAAFTAYWTASALGRVVRERNRRRESEPA